MIIVESKPMDDGRRYRRYHCFVCGTEGNSITQIHWLGKRPHPPAFARIYANPAQVDLFEEQLN